MGSLFASSSTSDPPHHQTINFQTLCNHEHAIITLVKGPYDYMNTYSNIQFGHLLCKKCNMNCYMYNITGLGWTLWNPKRNDEMIPISETKTNYKTF